MTYDQDAWYARMREVQAAGERVTLATICQTCSRPMPLGHPQRGLNVPRCDCGPVVTDAEQYDAHGFDEERWDASGLGLQLARLLEAGVKSRE